MKNMKSTIFGVVIAILVALFGLLQPAISGGTIDYKMLIPAAVIAIVGIVQKDLGSWHTTTIGIISAALLAGASTYQSGHHDWAYIIGAVLAAIGGSLTKDSQPKTGSIPAPSNNVTDPNVKS